MPDPSAGAAGLDASVTSFADEALPDKTEEVSSGGAGGALTVGRRWRNYTIKAELPGAPVGCFLATDVSVMADVIVQARPILESVTDLRRQVWGILQQLPEKAFARPLDAQEEEGFRYEISALPQGQSLREWLGAHRTDVATIETVVQQLARNIEALHEAGLAHLDLRPETIFIEEEESQLLVVIGGLQRAQPIDQQGLISIEVNPYYAPPEAGGLFQHAGGDGLRAWDWWALGRVVQEMVLGRHVYSLVMERDVRSNPPELRPRAEALLLERDPTALRAGAVELLPSDTGSRLRLILRGLLASVRDGRWRWREIEAWSRGEQPPDRYDLPRNAKLIRRGDRTLTLAELADLYSQPEHFAEGVTQLFPPEGATESLWALLQETPQFRAEFDQVRALREMIAMPPWEGVPIELRQSAVAGLVWLTLVNPAQRRPLCLDRHLINATDLRRLFQEAGTYTTEATLTTLTAEPYLQRVATLDPAARKTLDLLAKTGREAVAAAKMHGWESFSRPGAAAALLAWSMAPEPELQARRDALRAQYAVSDDPRLGAWLRASAPSRLELVLLAATGELAERHGYVTHDAWKRRRHTELMARAERITEALFWRQLERASALAPAVLGFWPVSLLIWGVPLTLAVIAHAWSFAALALTSAIAGRVIATVVARGLVARHAPARARWRWTDRSARCSREVLTLLPAEPQTTTRALRAELARIRQELKALQLPATWPQPPEPPRLDSLKALVVAALVLPLGLLGLIGTYRHGYHAAEPTSSPNPATVATASSLAATAVPRETLVEAVGPDGTVGLYEIVNDGFGGRRRGPLKRWDVAKPAVIAKLPVVAQTRASSAQRAFAVVSAELLLAPYPRQGRDVLLAVPVPNAQNVTPTVLLYDSATGRLADGWSYGVGAPLTPATWYDLTGREVVYLGEADLLQDED